METCVVLPQVAEVAKVAESFMYMDCTGIYGFV